MRRVGVVLTLCLATACGGERALNGGSARTFDPERDIVSLHYDHADDKDDGQSAAADRTLLEALFGRDWISRHVIPVSGAYGKNAELFNPESDVVMDAAWNEGGDDAFVRAATNHPVYSAVWRAAFAYYDPRERLDFSDTGELMHILGLGELGFEQFRRRYLDTEDSRAPR